MATLAQSPRRQMLGCRFPDYTRSSVDIDATLRRYQARCSDVIQRCKDLAVEETPPAAAAPLQRSVLASTAVGISWTKGSCCVVKPDAGSSAAATWLTAKLGKKFRRSYGVSTRCAAMPHVSMACAG